MVWKKLEITRIVLSVFGVASLLLATTNARAACGFSGIGQGSGIKLPMLVRLRANGMRQRTRS